MLSRGREMMDDAILSHVRHAATSAGAGIETIDIAGLPIATASRAALARAMISDCKRWHTSSQPRQPRLVFDANGHALSLRERDVEYRRSLSKADIVHADGGFLVTFSRLIGGPAIAERSATTDMLHDFAVACAREGLSFFLLGGTETVNHACAQQLCYRYPDLRIAGRHHGFFGRRDEKEVISRINATAPDVLWVGLGKPREQVFAARWRDKLTAGWIVTCGGCFNYVTGDYRRAPTWMQRANLEWLHRAITGPRGLLWRYLTTTPHALWLTLKSLRGGQ